MDRSLFSHRTQVTVRNYEIDWQGVVHNAVYLHYFETGRIEYLNHIGATVDVNTINNDGRVVLARNEIDYISPARFGDVLNVHSRVAWIRTTSFAFEGIIERDSTNEIVAENVAIHVWIHPKTGRPMPVPDDFRQLVQHYEGDRCLIQRRSTIA